MLRVISLLLTLLIIFFAVSGCAPAKPALASVIQATDENVFGESTPAQPASAVPTFEATQNDPTHGEQPPMKSDQAIEFSEADSGKSISTTSGTSITIRLKSQLSTGYSWIVKEMDEGIIVQEGEPQYTASSKLVGGAETVVWKFKSVGVGSAVLKLVYARSFEKDKPPLKTFELTIQVDK